MIEVRDERRLLGFIETSVPDFPHREVNIETHRNDDNDVPLITVVTLRRDTWRPRNIEPRKAYRTKATIEQLRALRDFREPTTKEHRQDRLENMRCINPAYFDEILRPLGCTLPELKPPEEGTYMRYFRRWERPDGWEPPR